MVLLTVVAALTGHAGLAAAAIAIEEPDRVIVAKFLEHARSEAKAITKESLAKVQTPEMFCWIEFPKLNMSLTAFELTGDVGHLRDFVAGFSEMRQALVKDPEGLLGWRGKPIAPLLDPAKPDVVINEIQAEYRAVAVVSRFLELADSTEETRKEFVPLRKEYLDLLENHLVRKWETRGHFADLGAKGGVYRWNKEYLPRYSGLTLSHEKQSIIIEGLLNLYRVTGKDDYLKRAAQLGTFLKRCMMLKEGRYAWNFWDPAGEWDISPEDKGKWKGWIGPEPKGQWFAATIGSAVQLYHHGVVFDARDIERLRKMQMEVAWNGDSESPKYFMVNGTAVKEPERMISLALTPFDAKLAAFVFGGKMQEERVAKSGNAWTGGVLAGDWLAAKYLVGPKAKDGKAVYGEAVKGFFAKPQNQQFLKSFQFEVTEESYRPPLTPGEFK